MKLDIFGSGEHTRRLELETSANELDIAYDDISFDHPITAACTCVRSGDLVRVECEVSTAVELTCSRCIEEFGQDVTGAFSLVVRKRRKGEAGGDWDEEEDDDSEFLVIDNDTNEIEIDEYVRDALILAVPLKPVCDEACRGLCSQCGANLNEGECDCSPEHTDSRWNDLGNLFDN